MNAEEALREIGKICEQVGAECCKEAVYRIGDVVKLSYDDADWYYIVAGDSSHTMVSNKIVLVNLATGSRHKESTSVCDKRAITQKEMDRAICYWVESMSPSTLKEAAANI